MRHIIKFITLIAVFICTSCGEEKKEEIKVLRPINYQEVTYLGSESQRTFNGTSKTDEVINLSFRSGGIISLFEIIFINLYIIF